MKEFELKDIPKAKYQGRHFFNWLKKVPEEPPQETMDDPRLADLAKKILEKQPNME